MELSSQFLEYIRDEFSTMGEKYIDDVDENRIKNMIKTE